MVNQVVWVQISQTKWNPRAYTAMLKMKQRTIKESKISSLVRLLEFPLHVRAHGH